MSVRSSASCDWNDSPRNLPEVTPSPRADAAICGASGVPVRWIDKLTSPFALSGSAPARASRSRGSCATATSAWTGRCNALAK